MKNFEKQVAPRKAKLIIGKLEVVKSLVDSTNLKDALLLTQSILKNVLNKKLCKRVMRYSFKKNKIQIPQPTILAMVRRLKKLHASDLEYINNQLDDDLQEKNVNIDERNEFSSNYQKYISKHELLNDYMLQQSLTHLQLKYLVRIEMHPTIKLWYVTKNNSKDNSNYYYFSAINLNQNRKISLRVIDTIIKKIKSVYIDYLKKNIKNIKTNRSTKDSYYDKKIKKLEQLEK